MNAELGSNEQDRRRDRMYIMAEILEVTLDGALKTQVMYRANLSFAQMNHYITLLLELKLLEINKDSRRNIYKTTTKGARFLESYKQMIDLLTKTKENDFSNNGNPKNGNHTVFIVNRGNHVVCREAP